MLRLPFLGSVLRVGSRTHWGIRRFLQRRQLLWERAYTDFKNRRARTTANLTRKNTRRAYERVYRDDRLLDEYLTPARAAFYREVALVAARFARHSVIDVGCGTGNLLYEIASRSTPERIVGIDHARAGVRRARERLPAGEFYTASLYDVSLEEKFDLVLCTEVLEHVRDPEGAVERLVGLCAASGAVVITVPDGSADVWEGHLHFWTDAELKEFLGHHGPVDVTRVDGDLLAILRPRG